MRVERGARARRDLAQRPEHSSVRLGMVHRIFQRVHFAAMPLSAIALLLVPLIACFACGHAVEPGPRSPAGLGEQAAVDPVEVTEQEFPRRAYSVVLTGDPHAEHINLLAGVVRQQLARSAARFEAGHPEAGMAAFRGATYLLRAGQHRRKMFELSADTLERVAAEVARTGNEGQALAIYSLLSEVLPAGPRRDDVQAHLAALDRWNGEAQGQGPLRRAGERERLYVQRALVEATQEALDRATKATLAWMQLALRSNLGELPGPTPEDREEALEAYRAIRAGGATLVGLYLRHGRPGLALEIVEREDLLGIVPPSLLERLERVAGGDDPRAWAELYASYRFLDSNDSPEMSLESEVAHAAAWGAALDLFRSSPGNLEAAKPLADLLVDHGMAEVAPLVLSSGLSEAPEPTSLSACLGLVLRAMLLEESSGQLAGARRTYDAAEPLLRLASEGSFAPKVRPSAAHLTYVMGELELRAAHPELAQPLLEAAAKVEPSSEVFLALASIHRQRGDAAAALEALERVIRMSRASGRILPEAEALLLAFEIHRGQGAMQRATERLSQALKLALDARQRARTDSDQAVAERLLARVLGYYRDQDGARRATRRALEASRSQSRQLTATVLDSAKLALTYGDLSAAREAVREAVEAELPDEDLIYVALWLQLLEFRLGVASNGTVESALATVRATSGWPAILRDWASGKLLNDALLSAARGPVERTEAMFYVAMRALTQFGDRSVLAQLEQVARSAAVGLVEVSIARELLLERSGKKLRPELPPGVVIP